MCIRDSDIAARAQVVNHRFDRDLRIKAEREPVEGVQADAWQIHQQRVVPAFKGGRADPVVEFLARIVADDDRRPLFPAGICLLYTSRCV